MAAMVVGCLGAVGWLVYSTMVVETKSEEEQFNEALGSYEQRTFSKAAERFRRMTDKFPQSPQRALYVFLAELSAVRDKAYGTTRDPLQAYEGLHQFVQDHRDDRAFEKYTKDVGQTYVQVARDLVHQAGKNLDRALLPKVKEALDEGGSYAPDEATEDIASQMADVTATIAKQEHLQRVLAQLDQWVKAPPKDALSIAERFVREQSKPDPSLRENAQVQERLAKFALAVRSQITWNEGEPRAGLTNTASEPGLLGVASAPSAGSLGAEIEPVVFAVARGVLYALRQSNGDLLWAVRVGIDTAMLPVRLPATRISSESVLVLSADTNTLTRRDAHTGQPVWTFRLTAPCLGRPAVTERRVYVPTIDGKVHEIDLIAGRLVGWYDVGKPLTVGPVYAPAFNLLYVPADSRQIYVLSLDPAARAQNPCPAILESGHPAGSLRSEPIIVSREELRQNFQLPVAAWPDYLVLNQADGLNALKLRVFALPIQDQAPLLEIPINGWSWFPPYHDGERLAQVTDTGVFALVGIKQVNDLDKDLFAMYLNEIALGGDGARPGRALVVHAAEDDFWVLAQGELQRLHFDRFGQGQSGPRVTPLWRQPVHLGSPLQVGQVDQNQTMLCLVTQSLGHETCLATAVDIQTGNVRWQRQLGLACLSDPVVAKGGVLAVDQGGDVFPFGPGSPAARANEQGDTVSRIVTKPGEQEAVHAYLLATPDGTAAYQVSCPLNGNNLHVRRYEGGKLTQEQSFVLGAPLSGTPALGAGFLLVPLANGDLLRQPLAGGNGTTGPTWRTHPEEDARAHVVALTGDEFLTTDGNRTLTRWRWPADRTFEKLTASEMPARIVSAPVVLPPIKGSADLLVCVGTSDGVLTVLKDSAGGTSQPRVWDKLRTWDHLKGKITAGPFLRGEQVGCVLDHRRLLWFDVTKDEPLWQYRAAESIIGQPEIVDGLLVVADLTGRYVGLDVATGQPGWVPGWTLKANVAPAATPVPFGNEQALAPLTDGTVLLLSLDRLRPPLASFNPFW